MTGLTDSVGELISEWERKYDDVDELIKWAEGYIKEHDRHMEQWFRLTENPTPTEAIRESSRFLRGKVK